MNIFLVKSLIGLGAAGVIGVGGYGIYAAVKKDETIFEALTQKKLTLLDTTGATDDSEWGEKVNSFNSGTDKLEGFEKQSPSNDGEANREAMKKACKNLVQSSFKNADMLKQAEKWCVKKQVITSRE